MALQTTDLDTFLKISPNPETCLKKYTGSVLKIDVEIDDEALSFLQDGEIELRLQTDLKETTKISSSVTEEIRLDQPGFYSFSLEYRTPGEEWKEATQPTDVHVHPKYMKESVVYNAFIRFFGQDGEVENGVEFGDVGTFDDLKNRLDYLKELGCDVLYLNPIHRTGNLFKKYNPHDQVPEQLQPGSPYSIRDFKSIDPELGIDVDHEESPTKSLSDPMQEFKILIEEAHKRDIKVYMDLVFNHTSHDSILQKMHPEWYLYKEDITSVEDRYIQPEEVKKGKPWGDPAHTFAPLDHGHWWSDAAQLNWEYMLPEAENEPPENPSLDEMWEYFKTIPKYWMNELNIDGFRCDVAYRIPPTFWKECIEEAQAFAKKKADEKDDFDEDIVFIAEARTNKLNELLEAGFASVYSDYEHKLYNPLTLKGYLDYLYNKSGNHFPENTTFFLFPECHDFKRNTEKIVGRHDDDTLAERANKSRWLITATIPGMPMLFNGFEKLEWEPINLFSYSQIDWEKDEELTDYVKKINTIQHENQALSTGDYHYIELERGLDEKTQIFSYARTGEETFLIFVNMDIRHEAMAVAHLPDSLITLHEPYILEDLITGERYEREGNHLFIRLDPGQGQIFKVE